MFVPTFAGLIVFVLLALPVAAIVTMLAFTLDQTVSFMPLTQALGDVAWSASSDFLLVAIPLFILLGEIILRGGLAQNMYNAMTAWVSWLPGGLMHSNIAAAALFGGPAGSSVATAATVGTIAIPVAKKHRYNEPLFLGSLAAGGTLGILIPPSVTMIVYGVLTNTSVPRLYMAGMIPGLVLTLMFMGYIALRCMANPSLDGDRPVVTWADRWRSLPDLLPMTILFVVIMGAIFIGLTSPTEAAALGIVVSLIMAAFARTLTWSMLVESIVNSMRTSATIMLIVLAAYYLNFVMATVGATSAITGFISALDMPAPLLLLTVVLILLIVGCMMDSLSIMIMFIPIVTPVVMHAGYDPVWFGIVIVLIIECGLIMPPMGLNLFVIQNIRKTGNISDVITGSAPFVLIMLLLVLLLYIFPGIALWLSDLVYA